MTKNETAKFVIQVIVSIASAILTALGATASDKGASLNFRINLNFKTWKFQKYSLSLWQIRSLD